MSLGDHEGSGSHQDRRHGNSEARPVYTLRPRDPGSFDGHPTSEADDWLADYERISRHNLWDDTVQLANVVFYLRETARTWFENHEDEFTSWESFKQQFRSVFCRAHDRQLTAKAKLETRAQLHGESFTSYIEDVLWLCRRADRKMSDQEKL